MRPTVTLALLFWTSVPWAASAQGDGDCTAVARLALEEVAASHWSAAVREAAASLEGGVAEACAGAAEVDAGVARLLAHLGDPAIRVLSASHTARLLEEWQGGPTTGVGLTEVLSLDTDEETDRLTVITPVPGSPAEEAGLRTGDVLTRIDGEPTAGMGLTGAMARLRVDAGERVRLTVLREDRAREVTLEARRLGEVAALRVERLRRAGRALLVLRLRQFTPGIGARVRQAVEATPDVDGIVLDLRENPGGFVPELVAVAGVFLPPGAAVATIAGPAPVGLAAESEAPPVATPLAVIMGRGSASAAEALAGALRHHGRGVLVGEWTYGKGLAHNLVPLGESGWSLMLPIGQLETPDGRPILASGVEPDVRTANPMTEAVRALRR